MARAVRFLLISLILSAGVFAAFRWWPFPEEAPAPAGPGPTSRSATATTPGAAASTPRRPAASATSSCLSPPGATAAAAANAGSLATAPWAVFGRPETGWSVYVPLVSREVGTGCPPDQPGFARAVQAWQATHGLPASGTMTAETLRALNLTWLERRPFVAATRGGGCPPPPAGDLLSGARPEEGYMGKAVRLHAQALAAYRRLAAAARAAVPDVAADPRLLTLVSGYRGPAEEAARCAEAARCGGASMARCSAHRTGLAMDLFLGAAPGVGPASSDEANRVFQSRSAAYRWLVLNADRFGFVPYPFEPWHWEYTPAPLGSPAGSTPPTP